MGRAGDASNMILEGCKVSALADSGSQVNMMMLEFVQKWGYLVLPLDRLVNYPCIWLDLVVDAHAPWDLSL